MVCSFKLVFDKYPVVIFRRCIFAENVSPKGAHLLFECFNLQI